MTIYLYADNESGRFTTLREDLAVQSQLGDSHIIESSWERIADELGKVQKNIGLRVVLPTQELLLATYVVIRQTTKSARVLLVLSVVILDLGPISFFFVYDLLACCTNQRTRTVLTKEADHLWSWFLSSFGING